MIAVPFISDALVCESKIVETFKQLQKKWQSLLIIWQLICHIQGHILLQINWKPFRSATTEKPMSNTEYDGLCRISSKIKGQGWVDN